jgi:hypothetical protein
MASRRKESENIFNKDHSAYPMQARQDCMTLSVIIKKKRKRKYFQQRPLIIPNASSSRLHDSISYQQAERSNQNKHQDF